MTRPVPMKPTSSRWAKYHKIRKETGYRSGLEVKVAEQLARMGVHPIYEPPQWITYIQPKILRKYKPDFILPNGIIIEVKGQFSQADRKKHILIKNNHPYLDIRFVFAQPETRLSKRPNTSTYAEWCEKKGFLWAAKWVPTRWVEEQKEAKRVAALETFGIIVP